MLLEIHMLKNYPATNLNRDDMGAPKSCMFGGVQRARISSQCLKRSWRISPVFQNELAGHLGVRTRKMPKLVKDKLMEMGVSEDFALAAEKKLTGFANKAGKERDDGITSQIAIYSPEDIEAIADVVKAKIEEVKDIKAFNKLKATDIEKEVTGAGARPISLDIALFGRMVTSPAFANVEASMQVAHAFSTNRVMMESDFFVAMDDMIDGHEELGAGMMDTVDYNSSCYYIYASLDTDKLLANLKNDENPKALVKAVIPSLLRTMAYSNPSGKQNSFAGNVLPSAVLVEGKEYPVPVSYANAFVKPARAFQSVDLVQDSIEKLQEQVLATERAFPSLAGAKRAWFNASGDTSEKEQAFCANERVQTAKNFDALIEAVCDWTQE